MKPREHLEGFEPFGELEEQTNSDSSPSINGSLPSPDYIDSEINRAKEGIIALQSVFLENLIRHHPEQAQKILQDFRNQFELFLGEKSSDVNWIRKITKRLIVDVQGLYFTARDENGNFDESHPFFDSDEHYGEHVTAIELWREYMSLMVSVIEELDSKIPEVRLTNLINQNPPTIH